MPILTYPLCNNKCMITRHSVACTCSIDWLSSITLKPNSFAFLVFTIQSSCEIAEIFSQLLLLLPAQPFLQADETLVANYEVVNQFNIEVLTRCDQLLRYSDILRRWAGIATRMIMTDNNGRAVAYNGRPIDLGST